VRIEHVFRRIPGRDVTPHRMVAHTHRPPRPRLTESIAALLEDSESQMDPLEGFVPLQLSKVEIIRT
jgi:hypothetical protein